MMPLLIQGSTTVSGIDVDVVFPLNDTTETVGSGEHEKTEMNS